MTKFYSTILVPRYVREFIGQWAIRVYKIDKHVWCFYSEETGRCILIRADVYTQAIRDLKKFVCHVSQVTDKRRLFWFYT